MAAPRNADIPGHILDVTAKLLKSSSFAEISLADIARAAGISKGTVHYHYKNKNDILFDIADRYLALLETRLTTWLNDPGKDTSYIRLLRYTFKDGIFDQSGSMRLYLVAAGVSGNEEVRSKLLLRYNTFKEMLDEAIRRRCPGIDANYTAWAILTAMDGLLVQSLLGNTEIDIDLFIEKTVRQMDGQRIHALEREARSEAGRAAAAPGTL